MSYAQLHARFEKISHLGHLAALAEWDEATMMPAGGAAARGAALGTLEELRHELSVDPEIEAWIGAAKSEDLDDWRRANLRQDRVFGVEFAQTIFERVKLGVRNFGRTVVVEVAVLANVLRELVGGGLGRHGRKPEAIP